MSAAAIGLTSLLWVCAFQPAEPVGPTAEWKFDEVYLTNGGKFRGMVLDDLPQGLRFQVVKRHPGRPTVTLTLWLTRGEVREVKKISPEEREILKGRLEALDQTGLGERARMHDLELEPADWPGRIGGAQQYRSDQFVLISSAPEEVTRRAAVRLEQIYTAFTRFLPPRIEPTQTTTVYLAGRVEDYRNLLGPGFGPVLNPATYDPKTRRIACGTDLLRLGEDLAANRVKHAQQLAGLKRYEAEIRQLYRGQKDDLNRFLQVANRERKQIFLANRANELAFDKATARLFGLLYHEAFHSYVSEYVYPPKGVADVKAGKGTGELPRWLNEGLAQIFETAVVEAGELQVGHADETRLRNVQESLGNAQKKDGLMPLSELLRAGANDFLAAHNNDRANSDRAYLTSWALAFYLTFDRRLIGTEAFEQFLRAVNTGAEPIQAFETLVGQDLLSFEKEFHQTMNRLKPDGTLEPAEGQQ